MKDVAYKKRGKKGIQCIVKELFSLAASESHYLNGLFSLKIHRIFIINQWDTQLPKN